LTPQIRPRNQGLRGLYFKASLENEPLITVVIAVRGTAVIHQKDGDGTSTAGNHAFRDPQGVNWPDREGNPQPVAPRNFLLDRACGLLWEVKKDIYLSRSAFP
jgi:hypothetical protein